MKRIPVIVSLVLLVIFIIADLWFHLTHGDGWWAGIPGFFALFAGLGCLVIIVTTGLLGRRWLLRKEDYYESGRDN